MKTEIDIKSQIEMSELLNQSSEEILNSIKTNNIDKFRRSLQLFIIQYDLYKDQIGENNGR